MNTHPGRNIDKWSNCNSWSSSSTLPFRKKEEKVTLSITQLCIQITEILLFSKVLRKQTYLCIGLSSKQKNK